MNDYKQLYKQKKSEYESEILNIIEDTPQNIRNFIGDFEIGYTNVFIDNFEYKSVTIYISSSLTDEMKLRVLFHEYGHAEYYTQLNPMIAMAREKYDKYNFDIDREYMAFHYELNEAKNLYNQGDKSYLINEIAILNSKLKNELNPVYKEAIKKLTEDDLWIECNNIVNE